MSQNTLRDSIIPYDTISTWVASNPCRYHPDNQDIILTCPVRLGFVHVETPQASKDDNGNDKESMYNLVALFPPQATAQVESFLIPIWEQASVRDFPKFVYEGKPTDSVHCPFYDQKKKIQYDGYVAGAYFLNLGSKFRPSVVDINMQPIPTGPAFKDRVYDGCWAILGINLYSFGKSGQSKNKGVKFGLTSIMIIADDEKFMGKAPDPQKVFSGVKIEKTFNAAGAFSASAPTAQPQAAQNVVPQSGPTGTAAPAQYTPPAQWPQGFPPDQMVAAGWTREQLLQNGYTPADLAHYGV